MAREGDVGKISPDTYIVSFQVKLCEVECDAILFGCHDLPYAVLVWGVEVWEGWTLDRAIGCVDVTTTGI